MGPEELGRENDALNEQVKLLVKTERRLYGAQHVIEQQLRRLQALTDLATTAARAGDPDVILTLALNTLLEILDFDQAVALTSATPSASRLAVVTTQPGCEPPERTWQGGALELPLVARPLLFRARPATVSRRIGALLDAVNDYFAPPGAVGASHRAPAIELIVPLRRKSGRPLALLVLRKLDFATSLHEGLVSDADLPFVELVATRVEIDVENVQLYRELESVAAGLEDKVAERTADLARSNAELGHSLRRVRETQARLVEASKRAALLTLVAGLSHELNNPIGVILGYAQGLLSGANDGTTRRQLAAIERQARRCSVLVRALLGFAENRPLALDSITPVMLLQRVIADVEHEAAERRVRVAIDVVPEGLPSLSISEESMRDALGQVVRNALAASVAGGSVLLHARERRRNAVWGVELSVRDRGAGIPRAFLSRVFDPFFTTKPPGKGVGLGLSLARQTVESHGGHIDVHSEVGRGTTVRVWLPVAAAATSTPEATERDTESMR